jgi:hypothetical protein
LPSDPEPTTSRRLGEGNAAMTPLSIAPASLALKGLTTQMQNVLAPWAIVGGPSGAKKTYVRIPGQPRLARQWARLRRGAKTLADKPPVPPLTDGLLLLSEA